MTLTVSATDTELQKPVNVIFQQTFLRNAQARAPYFAGTQPASLTINAGSATAKWRRIENMAPSTTALSEITGTASYGMGRSSVAASFTDVTATVSKYGQFYLVNEEADLFNFSGQMDKLVETLAIAAGRSANQLQRDIAEDNLTIIRTGGVASDGLIDQKIQVADIANAIVTINTNSALTFMPMSIGDERTGTSPILPAYWGICHPHMAYDISNLAGFKSVETYAGQVETVLGEFGTLGVGGQAVRFIQTEDASIDADAGASLGSTGLRGTTSVDLYTCVIYGRDALGSVGLGRQHTDGVFRAGENFEVFEMLMSQRMASPGDPFAEMQSLAYKFWWAGAVLNGAWGRSIRAGATSL